MIQNNEEHGLEETRPEGEPVQELPALPNKPAKKSRVPLLLVAGLVLLCGLVSIPVCQYLAGFFGSFPAEMESTSQVIHEYLTAMTLKDAERAYKLIDTTSDEPILLTDVQEMLVGRNYLLFSGYREHAFTDFNMTMIGSEKIAEIEGQVAYEGDFIGAYSAVLVKEAGTWKIQRLNIVAPIEKLTRED